MSENKAVMNVNSLLDMIDRMLDDGTSVIVMPGRRIVDVDRLHDGVDEVRRYLPGELHQAKAIVRDRAQILEEANERAEEIVKKAEDRARRLVSDQEILRAAEKRAYEIVTQAENEAKMTRQAVTNYCESMLKESEKTMTNNARALKEVHASLRKTAKNATEEEL